MEENRSLIVRSRLVLFPIQPVLKEQYVSSILGTVLIPRLVLNKIEESPIGGPVFFKDKRIEMLFFDDWQIEMSAQSTVFSDMLCQKAEYEFTTSPESCLWIFLPKYYIPAVLPSVISNFGDTVYYYRGDEKLDNRYFLTFEHQNNAPGPSYGYFCREIYGKRNTISLN